MIKFKILIFEKDKLIQDFLGDCDLIITSFTELESSASDAKKMSVDAIIIDMDCYDKKEVFKYVSDNADTNVFVVNANDDLKYQIYECGATDVMVMPLDRIELKYKIDIAIKKSKYKPNRYIVGDLTYEIETGTLMKESKSIVLPSLQNKIFALLLNAYYENRIVKKEEVFDSMIDESSRIQNHIARLRYSLSYIKSRQVIIETVYGKGYKLFVIDG